HHTNPHRLPKLTDSRLYALHSHCPDANPGPNGLRLPTLFFFNDPATTEIYTLSLHDALPIWEIHDRLPHARHARSRRVEGERARSEEHTSELQSRENLVCRLLLEKKNTNPARGRAIKSTPRTTESARAHVWTRVTRHSQRPPH